MAESLTAILIHIVFSTKNRDDFIDENISSELYLYITTILKNLSCDVYRVGGTKNHIHILCSLSKNRPLTEIIKEIKQSSSKWIKSKGQLYRNFYWQTGYGVFSVSSSQKDIVCNYIANQKQHHEKNTFEDEFKKLLVHYDVKFNEKYLWD